MVDNVSNNVGNRIISTLGAGSGIATGEITDQLVEIEQSVPQGNIDSKRESYEAQISDYGSLRSALATLQDAAKSLGDTSTFESKSASFGSSEAFVPTSLGEEAPVGNYTFTVESIARAQSLATSSYASKSSTVGKGTLTFSFGEWAGDLSGFTENAEKPSVSITIDESNNTLSGLRDAINAAKMGVQASIVNDGQNGYRLVIAAESGLSNQLSITAAETVGSEGLSALDFNENSQTITQNQSGADAHITFNGLDIYRSSNTIDDVIEGFEFNLAKADPGAPVSVNIFEDKAVAEESVRTFVESYNTFLDAIKTVVDYNAEEERDGALKGDTTTKTVLNQLRSMISAAVPGIEDGFNALANVGIRTELDGTISLNEDTFKKAFDENFDLVKAIFIPQVSSDTDKIVVTGYGDDTVAGSYDVQITQQPAQGYLLGGAASGTLLADLVTASTKSGYYTGGTPSSSLLTDMESASGYLTGAAAVIPLDLATQGAGANDYDFDITVDGVTSAASISLPVADYASYDDMATALQTAINNDANISGVSVSFDTDHFVISSATTGASSSVSVTDVGSNAADLGLSTGTETLGTGGASDYDFSITVDGIDSGTISITPGTYATEDDLATEIQTRINADTTLSGAGVSVAVTWVTDHFVVTSNSSGADSNVGAIAAIGAHASIFGLDSGTATAGSDDTADFDFTVTVDGVKSGTISLATGTYADESELASHIQQRINSDSKLLAAGADVEVVWNGTGFDITSTRFGSKSNVKFTGIGGSVSELGLDTGTSTSGKDVKGTVNGKEAFGLGDVLLPALNTPAYGLKFRISPSAVSGTVSFSRGFGGEFTSLIDAYLSNKGLISLREDNLETKLDKLDDDQEKLDRRMSAYRERLMAQFQAMERIIATINGNGSYLKDIADRLPNTAQRN